MGSSRRRGCRSSSSPTDSTRSGSDSDEGRSWRRERSSKDYRQIEKTLDSQKDERSCSTSRRKDVDNAVERSRSSPEHRGHNKGSQKDGNRRSPEGSIEKHLVKERKRSSSRCRRNTTRCRSRDRGQSLAESNRASKERNRSRERLERPQYKSTFRYCGQKDSRRDRTDSKERRHHKSNLRESPHERRNKSEHEKKTRGDSTCESETCDKYYATKYEQSSQGKSSRQQLAPRSRSTSDASRSTSYEQDCDEEKTKTERRHKDAMSKGEREKYSEFLKEEEVRRKEEKKRLKQLMKERETPEQKRARRLAKKEAKERKRKQEMGWDEEYAGYTNHDNPFGDSNLLQTFKWTKKLEKEGFKDIKDEELERMNRRKREEQRQELEKVKERRLERERERAERDAAIEMEQRQREGAQFEQWAAQEDSFHLQQAKLRSKIRIEDGRAKPIDLLARYISAEEEDFSVDMIEPYLYLNGLTLDDFEDLIEDISVYMRLESKKNQEYWNDIRIIVDEEVRQLNNEEKNALDDRSGRSAISTEVSSEIVSVFKGKTPKQLEVLKGQIELKLSNKAPGLDVAYWETLLSRLRSYMARARLRERHEENLRKKLEQLKMEQGVAEEEHIASRYTCAEGSSSPRTGQDEGSQTSERGELDPLQQSIEDYHAGRYTPTLLTTQELEPGTLLTDPDEDEQRREIRKMMLRSSGTAKLTRIEEEFEREARKGMDSDEARFSVEENLVDSQSYQWSDKWRPRKPRYFNRVHTGFEWNKYNQTHYDIDNPPPKIVQGYKFNIFYPDLIDKNKTPQYFLIPCKDNTDFSILRFHAGPPYEDIAFKVVNREWEYSYKKGFRCQFHNDIFQLWFHFKRYRYRR
ncbi:cactin-like [Varroa jacobsoni]|uniref:cactin-like n=1 Tax=Varroa jacobsoni TaxID=62625 RepID=UPI000BF4079A|nr:cactin-like [Varroa jacobsoni]